MRTSHFSLSKPDLTLHAGTDKHAPVVAVARMSSFTSTIRVGLGDPQANYGGVIWEELRRANWGNSKYQFEANVKSDRPSGRRSFMWKPTRNVGVGGSRPSRALGMINYKLVDSRTEEVVAVFEEAAWAMEKRGKLEFREHFGKEFYLLTLMSMLGILEKKSSERSAAAGGGGGGGC